MKIFPGTFNIVYLSVQAQHDLRWWQSALTQIPSRLLLRRRCPINLHSSSCVHITTDASGWGVGGFWEISPDDVRCFSFQWDPCSDPPHSTWGELFALVVAIALWDSLWDFKHIIWHTDCECHVTGLYKIRTRAPELLPLHDFIDLRSVSRGYQFSPRWIPGDANVLADSLSRKCFVEIPHNWKYCPITTLNLPIAFSGKLKH